MNSEGSWSEKKSKDFKKSSDFIILFLKELTAFDLTLNSKYKKEFEKLKRTIKLNFLKNGQIPLEHRLPVYYTPSDQSFMTKFFWYGLYSRFYYLPIINFNQTIRNGIKKMLGVQE